MSLYKKLYLLLLPALLLVFVGVGYAVYQHQLAHHKQMVLDNMVSRVNSALSASEYEQLSLAGHANDIATSPQFLRYIQNSNGPSLLSTLEHSILKSLNQSENDRFGVRHVFILDPAFDLKLSTYRTSPFEDLLIPDKIYNMAFDTYTKLLNSGKFVDSGQIYASLTGELRYLYTIAVDPSLILRDRRAQRNNDRYLLIVDGPLDQLSNIVSEYRNSENMSLTIEPLKVYGGEHSNSMEIDTLAEEGESLSVLMKSSNFQVEVNIAEEAFDDAKAKIIMTTSIYFILVFIGILIVVHVVVHKQLISPLKRLVNDVSTGGLQLRYFKRSDGKSEVDLIKNAYIDSLTELKFEAEFDQVTKLANRRSFFNYLDLRLNSYSNQNCFIVCWDIKEFRKINDLYGTDVGDRVLVKFASHLRQMISEHQAASGFGCNDYSIARFGGNQFIAIFEIDAPNQLVAQIKEFNKSLSSNLSVDYFNFRARMATAVFPLESVGNDELWHKGITEAMREAKSDNSDVSLCVYNQELVDKLERRDMITKMLVKCCDKGDFKLRFMPIFCGTNLHVVGFETLIFCPTLRDLGVGPDEFIPIAEQNNLITNIDYWVIENAINYYKKLVDKTNYKGSISINVSALELYNRKFVWSVKSVIERLDIPPENIIIEITETSYVKSSKLTIEILGQLRDMGFKVSLDDFGTGYTAFNQLLHYPVDELKIDKSFIDKIIEPGNDKEMVNSMIALGHSCGSLVVGEGVESAEQCEYLINHNCDLLQGYFLSMPLEGDEFLEFIQNYDPEVTLEKLPNQATVYSLRQGQPSQGKKA
ncbi:EAL domain-containing protein [Vibrio astriarenae]